jgi:L-lactate dehydrogenase complex protein LldG
MIKPTIQQTDNSFTNAAGVMGILNSRNNILKNVAKNKPDATLLPDISLFEKNSKGSLSNFIACLKNIGGATYVVHDAAEIMKIITDKFDPEGRVFTEVPEIKTLITHKFAAPQSGHELGDVEVGVIKAHFGVAENGAVWVTDDLLAFRALPFICQHLAVIINEKDILPTMHEAYLHPSLSNYTYGSFIAGPSKTADIEQSLVLGAHGPKSMTVFVMLDDKSY